jgi:hypothetical protein
MSGMAYTAVAIGNLADIGAILLTDDATGLAPTDIRITAVHSAAAVGQVDIWEVSGEPFAVLEDVDFGVSATLDLPAAPYTLGFDVDNDASPDLTFSIPKLPGGTQVNLHAVNDSGGAVYLLAVLPTGEPIRIDPS